LTVRDRAGEHRSMSLLVTARADDPARELARVSDGDAIARALAAEGVRFLRWPTRPLPADADGPRVLEAYAAEVACLTAEGPYPCVDVVRLHPDASDPAWPEKARAARAKFLEEHTHAEDEVRFFVEGAGAFYLRLGDKVHVVLCAAGDLISVPAGTRHWFDMGSAPSFCAVRFFGTKDGWVASFTGDPIARAFPSFDAVLAS
jgi:1,2-dihydroxy-3-keto-5-methylthiopentene dioxygenase